LEILVHFDTFETAFPNSANQQNVMCNAKLSLINSMKQLCIIGFIFLITSNIIAQISTYYTHAIHDLKPTFYQQSEIKKNRIKRIEIRYPKNLEGKKRLTTEYDQEGNIIREHILWKFKKGIFSTLYIYNYNERNLISTVFCSGNYNNGNMIFRDTSVFQYRNDTLISITNPYSLTDPPERRKSLLIMKFEINDHEYVEYEFPLNSKSDTVSNSYSSRRVFRYDNNNHKLSEEHYYSDFVERRIYSYNSADSSFILSEIFIDGKDTLKTMTQSCICNGNWKPKYCRYKGTTYKKRKIKYNQNNMPIKAILSGKWIILRKVRKYKYTYF
jgi:hypothetical protein